MTINEKEFEQLWERAATKQFVTDMNDGFPHWRRQRRQRRNTMMGLAAVCLIGGAVWFNFQPDKRYDTVACNRSGISNEYWLQVADEMLITKV